MSTKTQSIEQMPNEERRVILARKELYQSGNSLSVSIPQDTLANTAFNVGDHANIFTLLQAREIAITADTRRFYNMDGTRARGSRKIRESSHGTILLTIPPKALLEDLGYESLTAAKGEEVAITIDPVTTDLYLEFPDDGDVVEE